MSYSEPEKAISSVKLSLAWILLIAIGIILSVVGVEREGLFGVLLVPVAVTTAVTVRWIISKAN